MHIHLTCSKHRYKELLFFSSVGMEGFLAVVFGSKFLKRTGIMELEYFVVFYNDTIL